MTNSAAIRGMQAQLLFEAWALGKGYEAYRPVHEDGQIDLLLREMVGTVSGQQARVWGVQIKRTYEKDGHPTINLKRRDGSRYDHKQIDYFAAVDVERHTIQLIPFYATLNPFTGEPKGRLRVSIEKLNQYVVKEPSRIGIGASR